MWKDFFMFCWWWQWWITHYICVALFGLLIAFKDSHLIFRTTCNLLKASLQMSKQLRDDKQLAQDHMFSGNGGWLNQWFSFLRPHSGPFYEPYNANLKAIFPSKCTHISYTSQLKLYYLNLFDMPEVKDPKGREWKRKFLPE